MDKLNEHSVPVRVSRHYDRRFIKFWVRSLEDWRRLNQQVEAAHREGLGFTTKGEVRFCLTKTDDRVGSSPGRLGVMRTGARKRL